MNNLMVLSWCAQIPDSDRATGTWFEELAAPYYAFRSAGAQVTLISPTGGAAPIDPASLEDGSQTDMTRRFAPDTEAQSALANAHALGSIQAESYDAVFYSGGLGPVFDLTHDMTSAAFIEAFDCAGNQLPPCVRGWPPCGKPRRLTADPWFTVAR